MLRKTIGILAVATLTAVPVWAQGPPDPQPSIDAVKKVAFLEGTWVGEGWIQMGPGGRKEFTQVENVQMKMDGAVLMIEGVGHSKEDATKKVHDALALISFDPVDSTLVFSAFVAGRPRLDVVPEVTENGFTWGFSPPNGGHVRYTIVVENDTWDEVGEYSGDAKTWFQFFEMHVVKQ